MASEAGVCKSEAEHEVRSHEEIEPASRSRKPLSFWLSFIALNITTFIVSLDSTALAVAVPVLDQIALAFLQC